MTWHMLWIWRKFYAQLSLSVIRSVMTFWVQICHCLRCLCYEPIHHNLSVSLSWTSQTLLHIQYIVKVSCQSYEHPFKVSVTNCSLMTSEGLKQLSSYNKATFTAGKSANIHFFWFCCSYATQIWFLSLSLNI